MIHTTTHGLGAVVTADLDKIIAAHVAASVAPYKEALASMVSMVRSGEPFHDDGSCAGCNKILQLLTPTEEGQDGK